VKASLTRATQSTDSTCSLFAEIAACVLPAEPLPPCTVCGSADDKQSSSSDDKQSSRFLQLLQAGDKKVSFTLVAFKLAHVRQFCALLPTNTFCAVSFGRLARIVRRTKAYRSVLLCVVLVLVSLGVLAGPRGI
jgi:hypothetical protein